MNSQILAQLAAGVRLVQGLTGETVTIANVDYPCTIASMVGDAAEWVQGGRIKKSTVTVLVLQNDLPTEPDVDTLCSFRGIAYRVITTDNATTYWQLTLLQAGA
jgi:hypothetical protein